MDWCIELGSYFVSRINEVDLYPVKQLTIQWLGDKDQLNQLIDRWFVWIGGFGSKPINPFSILLIYSRSPMDQSILNRSTEYFASVDSIDRSDG